VRQLVRREATPDARPSGEPAQLGEAGGLLLAGFEEGLPPILRRAGQQYLARRGAVDPCVLRFLPREVDDLYARRVLFTMRTTGKGSAIPLEREDAIVFRLDDGRITRIDYYNDQHQARVEYGLPK
jgi:hypothetical protein